jgi:putative Holliday junction resolvase
MILGHVSRQEDASAIVRIAVEQHCERIVLGLPLDSDGQPGPRARSVMRLADAIRQMATLPVDLWDESFSSQDARQFLVLTGAKKKRRAQPQDDLAASLILQDYLNNQPESLRSEKNA